MRYFLLAILCVVGCMVGLIVLLGWHLGMDVTVNGHGHVQPIKRNVVKSRRPGLIKNVLVQQGQTSNRVICWWRWMIPICVMIGAN